MLQPVAPGCDHDAEPTLDEPGKDAPPRRGRGACRQAGPGPLLEGRPAASLGGAANCWEDAGEQPLRVLACPSEEMRFLFSASTSEFAVPLFMCLKSQHFQVCFWCGK